jgi:hypothetical protein
MNASFLALPLWFIPACTVASGVLIAAIKMRPANKRADNDAARIRQQDAASAEHVTAAQWERFQGEITRLAERVKALEGKVDELEGELSASHEREQAAIARAITAEAENARLNAILLARGQMRQEAAGIVAIERVEDARKRNASEKGGDE